MLEKLGIINLGLGKISSTRVKNIDPPGTSLERHVAEGYPHWKQIELTKYDWVFATVRNYDLTATRRIDDSDVCQPYVYPLPDNCLKPIRDEYTEWQQVGRDLRSAADTLKINYISDKPESQFDPLFVEVLACRIAQESVEYVTQSNTKKADKDMMYSLAVRDAVRNNAMVIGVRKIARNEQSFPFINGRFGNG